MSVSCRQENTRSLWGVFYMTAKAERRTKKEMEWYWIILIALGVSLLTELTVRAIVYRMRKHRIKKWIEKLVREELEGL
jgi:hypothetical protein